MQGYTQEDPVGTLKKKKPNSNHNSSQDCALQKPSETLLETQLQYTQMKKKYLHPGQFTISKLPTKENQFLTTGTSNSPIQFLMEQLHKELDPSQHQQEMCIHNVTSEQYTEETNLQPQCLLDHVMITTETTVEITDKCTTKITSNYAIQMSGKKSTTTKEDSEEESSIPKKFSKETSKNEMPGNPLNNTKTGRSILTLLQKDLEKELLNQQEIQNLPSVMEVTPIHTNQKKTPLKQQVEEVWEPPKKIPVQEEREKWVHLLQKLAQQNGSTENLNQKSSANEVVSFYTIIFWVYSGVMGNQWVFSFEVSYQWVFSGAVGHQWVFSGAVGDQWVFSFQVNYQWVFSGAVGDQWVFSGAVGDQWVFSFEVGDQWVFSSVVGNQWVFSFEVSYQYQWVFSGAVGDQWVFSFEVGDQWVFSSVVGDQLVFSGAVGNQWVFSFEVSYQWVFSGAVGDQWVFSFEVSYQWVFSFEVGDK